MALKWMMGEIRLTDITALLVLGVTVLNTAIMAITRAAVADLRAELIDRLADLRTEMDREFARRSEVGEMDQRLRTIERERWRAS